MRFVINGSEVFNVTLLVVALVVVAMILFVCGVVNFLSDKEPSLISKGGVNLPNTSDKRLPSLQGSGGSANDLRKLLDNGHYVLIFRNCLGSYTTVAIKPSVSLIDMIDEADDSHITDDFTPKKAFYRLVEKVTTGRIV